MSDVVTSMTNTELAQIASIPKDVVTELASGDLGSDSFAAAANTFLTAIVDKIVYQKVDSFSMANPFSRFDGEDVPFGQTLEDIYIQPAKGVKFDKSKIDPYEKFLPTAIAKYFSINLKMQYGVSIETTELQRACFNEGGFSKIVSKIVDSLIQGKYMDQYNATLVALDNAEAYANGLESLTYASGATDADKAGIAVKALVNASTDMSIPCVDNNKARVMSVSNKQDLILIIKNTLLNSINLDYLKGVFNLDKVQLIDNIIPVRSFETCVYDKDGTTVLDSYGNDIDFVIVDKDFFEFHNAVDARGDIINLRAMYINHWYNTWRVMGLKSYKNARAFKLTQAAS